MGLRSYYKCGKEEQAESCGAEHEFILADSSTKFFAFHPSLNSFWGRHLRNIFGHIGAKLFKRPRECFAFNYLSRMWVTQSQWLPVCMWQHHGQFMRLLCVCYMCHFFPAKHESTFFSLMYNAFEIIRNLNIHFTLKGAFNISKM